MKKVLAFALALSMLLAALPAFAAEEVNVFNWEDYICEDAINLFEAETGIKVNYMRFTTNEDMLVQVENDPKSYDVIFPSDYMIERMINEDMLAKIDYEKLPNYANIDDKFKDLPYDPQGQYSVPYLWGILGIIYNTTMVDEPVDSWDILWDEKYSGDILMIGNQRDAIAVALKRLGFSMNTTDETELLGAENELKKQKDLLQAYVMDQSYNKMEGNSAALCLYYSGDALAMMENNPDLSFAVPEEGSNYYMDSMCIPKNAKNMDEAHEYINFMLEAESGLRNSEEVYGSTPNKETFKLLDPDSQASEFMYPSDEVLAKSEMYSALPEDTYKLYDEIWKNLGQ